MNYHQIDIDESLRNHFLVFKITRAERYLNMSVSISVVLAFVFISFLGIRNAVNNLDSLLVPIALAILSVCFAGAIFFSLLNDTNLLGINGTGGKKENNDLIKLIAESNEWEILADLERITVLKPESMWQGFHWGRQLVVLYEDKNIFVNCLAFDKFGNSSPFHWFGNRKFEQYIESQFGENS